MVVSLILYIGGYWSRSGTVTKIQTKRRVTDWARTAGDVARQKLDVEWQM